MRLKSLELQGFKTFPDKTKLVFEDGISAVVGPNGSGKSNISDAVRWVLGEQSAKSLRCVKMEDVIFSGTSGRKGLGFAEVTLTIDNTSRYLPYDGDTVAITRRYYRSGDSEYLINKATVRLKDIHELFMDTGMGRDGYSMIGQGKIDSVISAKSEERREIFEEAAGISRYRYRKEESERKLARTEENLLRLQDIVSELKDRVGPLQEQAEKAKTYLALYQEKRQLEIGLWLYTLSRSGEVLKEHEEKISIARSQHDDILAKSEALDQEIERLFEKTNECLAKAEQARNESAKAEGLAVSKDGEVSVLQNDMHHNQETIGRLTAEQIRFGNDDKQFHALLQEKQEEITTLDETLQSQEQQCRETEERLEQLRKNMTVSADQQEIANTQIERLSQQASNVKLSAMQASSSAEELALRIGTIAQTVTQKQEQQQRLETQVMAQKELLQSAQETEQMLRDDLQKLEEALTDSAKERETAKSQRDQVYLDLQETNRRAKILEDLERSMEGFAHSVKAVMRMSEKGELAGIHGPVSRLLTVPKAYAVAIETALGGAAQHIVVATEEEAKAAIQKLKQKDGGRATFLPMTTIRGKLLTEPGLEKTSGFVGIAGKLCQCEEQYSGILQSLLGRIVVADTLDHAVSIAKQFRYQFRVVTLDGQVVNAGGSLTGGSFARKTGLLSRGSEIDALHEKSRQLEQIYQQKNQLVMEMDEKNAAWQTTLQETRQKLSQSANVRLEMAGKLHQLESDLSAGEHQLKELLTEKHFAEQRRQDLQTTQKDAQDQLALLEKETLKAQAELGKITSGRSALQQTAETLTQQLQEMRIALLTVQKDREAVLRDAQSLREKIQEGSNQARHIAEELVWMREKNQQLAQTIETVQTQARVFREQAIQYKKEAEQQQETRMRLEQKSVELRAAEKEQSAQKETIGRELSRLEERKQNLQREYDEIIERLWNEYELTRREAEAEAEPVSDANQASRRLRELKNEIKKLGNVNVSAIEEYAEVSERYEFLTQQVTDVEKSRTELHKLIRELTHQMTDIFKSRFAEINGYFEKTFVELFRGGKAHLELSEPEDVLNSGIVILAQPPGKIVKNLELLSGGEKALVAIALYFSIMKVSPPPFCMLDEIEAALDDVNVTRFAEYLRRMNQNTQFIVITHRRGTMEEADVLYGVTMQEEGISKLLKLDPSEIGNQAGVK